MATAFFLPQDANRVAAEAKVVAAVVVVAEPIITIAGADVGVDAAVVLAAVAVAGQIAPPEVTTTPNESAALSEGERRR